MVWAIGMAVQHYTSRLHLSGKSRFHAQFIAQEEKYELAMVQAAPFVHINRNQSSCCHLSGFLCCSAVTARATSPLQSLAGFHGAQTMTAAADSPGYLWTRSNSSWDAEPPASGGASQWEDFISGVKQIILTQSSHFACFFWRGFDPKSVRKASKQPGKIFPP